MMWNFAEVSEWNMIKSIESYGVVGVVVSFIVLIIGGVVRSKWFGDVWAKFTDNVIENILKYKTGKLGEPISESSVINHDVFNYIDFWAYSKIPTIQLSTEYRNVVFRKYLTIFLKTYKSNMSDFVKSGKYKEMDRSELWKNMLNIINDIIYQYEKECIEAGIPQIVVDKMKQKNNDTIQLTINLIQNISESSFYQGDDNLLRMYSILNIILSVLENTISNSVNVCNSINGQLKGLSMDGQTEP